MILSLVLAATLACQAPSSPPAMGPAPASGPKPPAQTETLQLGTLYRDWSRSDSPPPATSPATPQPTPSVADLFRERNAREAAARAATAQPAEEPSGYHCRRTATTVTCGTDENAMRESEERAKALLDQMLSPN